MLYQPNEWMNCLAVLIVDVLVHAAILAVVIFAWWQSELTLFEQLGLSGLILLIGITGYVSIMAIWGDTKEAFKNR